MTWNHRVLRKVNKSEEYFEVHEVYYKENGEINVWTLDPISPIGETVDELKEQLQQMLRACDKPILEEDGEKLKEIK